MRTVVALAFLGLLLFAATATGEEYAPGFGPNPKLPEPAHSLVPTVNIAPAKSWPAGATPTAAEGPQVAALAKDLDHPRWLYVLPNGDILVAETDAPPRPEEGNGLKAWFMSFFQKRAGSTRTASPNRITLLRDADGDGIAEIKRPFLTGLNSPFGMALVGDALYVANTDALMRFHYDGENVSPTGEKVADLPGTVGSARGHPDRLRRRRRECAWAPRGRRGREDGRVAGGGRRGQYHLARGTCLAQAGTRPADPLSSRRCARAAPD
jgi:glucose/arabinose dehydrogenase